MFCGGVSVRLNVNAEYVVCFDNNKKVVEPYKLLTFSPKN
jgi:site-specific DNA-adenine methylase